MIKYSAIPDKILAADGEMADNPEKERHGVRRFRAGMRNKKGKKDKNLNKHLLYHLIDDSELTWENAVKVALRYEMSHDSPSSSSSSSSSDSDDEIQTIEISSGKNPAETKNAQKRKSGVRTISALAKQVSENRKEIQKIKANQETLIAEFAEIKSLVGALEQQFAQSQPCNGNYDTSSGLDRFSTQWDGRY